MSHLFKHGNATIDLEDHFSRADGTANSENKKVILENGIPTM
ncbi:hypothetical protein [Amycolatopsis sp. MJM2582]|nr:hypothetical protein [Amycolatopsis sp. MJM2582]